MTDQQLLAENAEGSDSNLLQTPKLNLMGLEKYSKFLHLYWIRGSGVHKASLSCNPEFCLARM